MRTVKWNAFLSCLCGLAVVLGGVAVSARADVTTEKGASILIFPKVRADGTFDTIIQIANTDNNMRYAHCFYVNATLLDSLTQLPCTVPSSTCLPQCQETDFTIWLTKQQPTHWSVSQGRNIDLDGNFCSSEDSFEECSDAGFFPGRIPPVGGFVGELKCIMVDESGAPLTANFLKGEATLISVNSAGSTLSSDLTVEGDVAKYNAIGIRGNPDVAPGNPLLLDGGATYDACPAKLILDHFASGAPDRVAAAIFDSACVGGVNATMPCASAGDCPGGACSVGTDAFSSSVFTDLTLVPCNEDFENQIPKWVTVQFIVYSEFEERYSTSITVSCFLETELANIGQVFTFGFLGTDVAQAVITPVVQTDGSSGGLVGIAERISTLKVGTRAATAGRAAYNLHSEGSFIPPIGPDAITLPVESQ